MADEDKNETTEQAEEPVAEEPQADEPVTEEPVADETAAEAPASEEPAAETAAEPEPEPTHPREARKLARRQNRGEARPSRSPDERAAERDAARGAKAARRSAWRTRSREKARQRRADAPPAPATEPVARPHGGPKVRQGVVVSDRADKTITVRIDITRRHPRYEKIVRSSTTLHVHDERNEAHAGDTVRVVESRPLSRTKRWRLVEVLERAR
jgi:small subunit ribosomal protein S17